jgi:HTH-type transcriptional regulator / antitoxin HipB
MTVIGKLSIGAYMIGQIYTSLLKARQAKKLSQIELSRLLDIPQSYISQVEQSKHDIKITTLLNWARVLDLEIMLVPRNLVNTVSYLLSPKKSEPDSLPAAYGPLPDEVQ